MYKSLMLNGPKHGEIIKLKFATKQTVCHADGELHLYKLADKVAHHAIYIYAGVKETEREAKGSVQP